MPPRRDLHHPVLRLLRAAKALLTRKNAPFRKSMSPASGCAGQMVARASGQTTVPQIFISGAHVGGCDELYALEGAGTLDPLLAGEKVELRRARHRTTTRPTLHAAIIQMRTALSPEPSFEQRSALIRQRARRGRLCAHARDDQSDGGEPEILFAHRRRTRTAIPRWRNFANWRASRDLPAYRIAGGQCAPSVPPIARS